MIFKYYIKMNEQALLSAGKNYDLDRMYEVFDKLFTKCGFTKNNAIVDGIEYVGGTSPVECFRINRQLEKEDWFLPYCEVWNWLEDEDEKGVFEVYDRLSDLRKRGEL